MKQVWKRRAVAAAVVVLVGTSVYLNWRYAGDVADTSKVLGQSTLVNGETADYDTAGSYWAFYIDGEYAMAGVDYTAPEAGKTYAFKVEQAAG